MKYQFGSSRPIENTDKTSETPIVEQRPKSQETQESYEDCWAEGSEVKENTVEKMSEVQEAEEDSEDYDDCWLEKDAVEKNKTETEENTEKDDTSDHFDDCGKKNGDISETGEKLEKQEIEEDLTEEMEDKSEGGEIEASAVKDAVEQETEEETEQIEEREEEVEQKEESLESDMEDDVELQSFDEKLKKVMDSEEATFSEAAELKEKSQKQLADMEARKEELSEASREKFQAVMEYERGTEEYKEALKDYNDTLTEREQLDTELSAFKERHELLEKKSVELRQAQVEKGEAALVDSQETLAASEELQERYEEAYYAEKPDEQKLDEIQAKNTEVIQELSAEKDSVKLAMDAKMAEISEYVISHNLERYDTERDTYYQSLIAQYQTLQDSYRKIDYNMVKLDENSISIAEINGKPYESLRYESRPKIKEAAEGVDVPGETDYFVDETRAEQVLSPFNQQNWEHMSVEERRDAIDQLADYNADILGIDIRPSIRYYWSEDPADCGAFSEKENTIYINEYNVDNALETADTVSHEYRHCYQYMRAEKLENERDLAYREGFENYIRAEDDYAGYKSQLVETDAREYAQAVRDKITENSEQKELSEHTEMPGDVLVRADAIDMSTARGINGDQFWEHHGNTKEDYIRIAEKLPDVYAALENGRTFEELKQDSELSDTVHAYFDEQNMIQVERCEDGALAFIDDGRHRVLAAQEIGCKIPVKIIDSSGDGAELHEGVENKRAELRQSAEGLELQELQEVKERVRGIYDNGAQIADYVEEFNNYKEHHLLEGGHIEKVHDKSLEAAEAVEQLFSDNDYEGLYGDSVDRKTLEIMALYHDTGMDGNIDFSEYAEAKNRYLAEGRKGEASEKSFEESFRKNHSVQSAIHVLRDRQFIEGKNVNADEVALGCLAHSKSNSGVTNLADNVEWEGAIARLNSAVEEFNEAHPDEKIYFDSSFLQDSEGNLSKEKMARLRSESLCLRIGDANGHDFESRISQNGKQIAFDIDKWEMSERQMNDDLRRKTETSDTTGISDEVKNAEISIDGVLLDEKNDPNGVSRMFAVGEGNFKSLDFSADNAGAVETISLVKGDAYPLSTQFCIEERIKELNTAAVSENENVERYEGMSDKDYGKMVKEMQNSLPKANIRTTIDLGRASERTVRSYQAFAARIRGKYGIHVEVEYENA